MSYEELVESKKNIGDMTKEELFTYCGGLLSEVWDYEKENEQLHNKVEELMELYTTERHCKDDYKAIINELEKWLEVNLTNLEKEKANNTYDKGLKQGMLSNGRLIKNKLQELKGSNKE